MISIKYILVGPNGKYLQSNGEFDNPIDTAIKFSSLEEITTYVEDNLSIDMYNTITCVVKS